MKIYLCLLLLSLSQISFGRELYEWIDENGHKHYSDTVHSNAKLVKTIIQNEPLLDRSEKSIRLSIDSQKAHIAALWLKTLKSDPLFNGKLEVKLTIDPNGVVTDATAFKSTLSDHSVEKLFLEKFREIHFNKENVKATTYVYSMDFLPK